MSQSLHANVDEALVKTWIDEVGTDASCTVPLLQKIQDQYGYLPQDAMDIVVDNTDITGSQLFGVATFYSQFRLDPVGRHMVRVCTGTACHVRGSERIKTSVKHVLHLDGNNDTAEDGSYTVEDVACVGCCSQAPVMMIDGSVHGELKGVDAQKAIKRHARSVKETI